MLTVPLFLSASPFPDTRGDALYGTLPIRALCLLVIPFFTPDVAACSRELHDSLQKINQLPQATTIYCGHEYTLENLKFARSVEPDNHAIVERATAVDLLLKKQNFYGPSTLAQELATNPFLRTGETTIRRNLGLPEATDEAMFGELRRRKDRF